MNHRFLFLLVIVMILVMTIACAPAATPLPIAAPPQAASQSQQAKPPASSAALPQAPVSAPSSSGANAGISSSSVTGLAANVTNAQRKIIKTAQLLLTVESTDVALDRLTGIAADTGGYIVSTRVFTEGGLKAATITFAVPVDQFETSMRRTRAVALKVETESSSGQDVTDQYVDLESQLRNLEATADRIREFLKKANTVEEALRVNQQLADVEKQIETVKGKMNYMGDRSSFSTITADLRQPRPTPTPAPTLMPVVIVTPSPTPTPLPWNPGDTLKNATTTQVNMMTALIQAVTDLTIWLVVVILPYALVFTGIAWVFVRVRNWVNRKFPGSPPKPPDS